MKNRDIRTAALTFVVGVLLIGIGLTGLWSETNLQLGVAQSRWWLVLPLAMGCVSLVFKRKAPLLTLGIGVVLMGVDASLGGSVAMLLVFFDLLYTASLLATPRVRKVLWVGGALLTVAPMAYALTGTVDLRIIAFIGLQQAALYLCPQWWAMDVRRKSELADAAAARADAVERLAHVNQQRAVRAERDAMARDLHDVVASHLSAIALHSGGALATPPDTGKDRAALEQVRRSALESMTEMQTMIVLLRSPDEETEPDDDAQLPRLSHLEPLLSNARANGLAVSLQDRRRGSGPGAAVELVGYRIVQEALTNAAKHAGGSTVVVALADDDGELTITVRNTLAVRNTVTERGTPGERSTLAAPAGLGMGMGTMQERARAIGGTVHVSADNDSWTVTAALPITQSSLVPHPAELAT